MPAGLQVFNDYGVTQITGEDSSPIVVASGVLSTTWDSANKFAIGYVSVPTDASAAVIDLQGVWAVVGINYMGNGRLTVYTQTPVSFNYFVFAPRQHILGNFGLEVFSPNGVLVYSSTTKLLRVVYAGSFSDKSVSIPLVSGRTYGVANTMSRSIMLTAGYAQDCYKFVNGQIHRGMLLTFDGGSPNWGYASAYFDAVLPPVSFIAADITGY